MNRHLWLVVICVLAVTPLVGGCPTRFQGSALYTGGPERCFSHCQEQGMRMSQFVFVGSYSSACVCELVPVGAAGGAPSASRRSGASAATIAAAAGVTQAAFEE